MSIKEALEQYLRKEITAIELIRLLSGTVNPEQALDVIALINQISRHELGDLDTETFKQIWELE